MKDYVRFFDKVTFLLMLGLCLVGIFLIYSAGYSAQKNYFLLQILWLVISLLAFALVFLFKTEFLFRNAHWFLGIVIAGLVFQLVAGPVIAHTKSWIKLGFFQVQVSEFVKIPLAMVLARYLATIEVIGLRQFASLLAMIGLPLILIAMQPDFGVSFVVCSYFLIILFLKKIKLNVLFFTLLLTAAVIVFGWNLLKPYQKARIISFLNPAQYSQKEGYHVIQSKIAIGSGGLTGKGFMKGSQSQYRFLPTRHTDFIIAVLGEEMGFFSIGFLIFIFLLFFYRQLIFKFQTDEEFYYVYLFNGLIFFQFIVNVTMAIGLFPVLGISLPFISYGGSSLLSFFIGEAILFRIKINSYLT